MNYLREWLRRRPVYQAFHRHPVDPGPVHISS